MSSIDIDIDDSSSMSRDLRSHIGFSGTCAYSPILDSHALSQMSR